MFRLLVTITLLLVALFFTTTTRIVAAESSPSSSSSLYSNSSRRLDYSSSSFSSGVSAGGPVITNVTAGPVNCFNNYCSGGAVLTFYGQNFYNTLWDAFVSLNSSGTPAIRCASGQLLNNSAATCVLPTPPLSWQNGRIYLIAVDSNFSTTIFDTRLSFYFASSSTGGSPVQASSSSSSIRISSPPVIYSVSGCFSYGPWESTCAFGSPITITGANFYSPLQVRLTSQYVINNEYVNCSNIISNATLITCQLPYIKNATKWVYGYLSMTAITPSGSSPWFRSNLYYNQTVYPLPNVTSIAGCPRIGCARGNRLTITGESFRFVSQVQISVGSLNNYQQCQYSAVYDDNFVNCVLPAVDASWINSNFTLKLVSPAGNSSIRTNLFYSSIPFAVLTVTGCTNGYACQSYDTITITGNNLNSTRQVQIFIPQISDSYYQNCSIISNSASVVICTLPQGIQQWVNSYQFSINVFTPLGNLNFQTGMYYTRLLLASSSSTGGSSGQIFSSSSLVSPPSITLITGCSNTGCTSNSRITITGANLSPAQQVHIAIPSLPNNYGNCSIWANSPSNIVCNLPDGAGKATWINYYLYVTVITPAGSSLAFRSSLYYNQTIYPVPSIITVTGCPASGCTSGAQIAIYGQYFNLVTQVQLTVRGFSNYLLCSNVQIYTNYVYCNLPVADAAWVNSYFTVNLITPNGNNSTQTNLYYSFATPSIASVTGCGGGCKSNDVITISGSNLNPAQQVRISVPALGSYYQNCSIRTSAASAITCALPQGIQQWVLSYYFYINVFTPLGNTSFQTSLYYSRFDISSSSSSGTSGGTGRFSSSTVVAQPTISSVTGCNNRACTSGNLITINGANLTPLTRVEISVPAWGNDYQICSLNSAYSNVIYCYLPTGNTIWYGYNFVVRVVTSTASSAMFQTNLYYLSISTSSSSTGGNGPLPVIYTVNGCNNYRCTPGNQITITGANLSPMTRVEVSIPTLGGASQNCTITAISSSLVYCNLPAGSTQWLQYYLYFRAVTPAGSSNNFGTSLYYISTVTTSSSSTGIRGFSSSSSPLPLPVIYNAYGCTNGRCTSGSQVTITGINFTPLSRVEVSSSSSGSDAEICSATSYSYNYIYCNLPTGKSSWLYVDLYLKVVTSVGSSTPYWSSLYYTTILTSSSTGIGRSSTGVSGTSSPSALPSISGVTGCNNGGCTADQIITITGFNLLPTQRVDIDISNLFTGYKTCTLYQSTSTTIECWLPTVTSAWTSTYLYVRVLTPSGYSTGFPSRLYYISLSSTGGQNPRPSSSSSSANPNVPSITSILGCGASRQCYSGYRISMIGANVNKNDVKEIRIIFPIPSNVYYCSDILAGDSPNEITCSLPSVPLDLFSFFFSVVVVNSYGASNPSPSYMVYSSRVSSTASQFIPSSDSSSSSSVTVSLVGWLLISAAVLVVLLIIGCVGWMLCMKRSINIFNGSFIRRTPPAAMSESLLMANGGHRSDKPNAAAAGGVLELNSYVPPVMPAMPPSSSPSPNAYPSHYSAPLVGDSSVVPPPASAQNNNSSDVRYYSRA